MTACKRPSGPSVRNPRGRPEENQPRLLTNRSENTNPEEGKHSILFAPKLIIKANISIQILSLRRRFSISQEVNILRKGVPFQGVTLGMDADVTPGPRLRVGPWRARPPVFIPTACFMPRYLWTASCSLHSHLSHHHLLQIFSGTL